MGAVALFVLLVGLLAVHSTIPKVKIIPAAYLEKISDVVLYEGHMKIIFKVKLPEHHPLNADKKYWKTSHSTGIEVDAYIWNLHEDYVDEMGLSNSTSAGPIRKKRQLLLSAGALAAGYVIHFVFSKVSDALFGSEDHIVNQINQLHKAVQQEDRQNFVLIQELQSYSEKMKIFHRRMVARIDQNTGITKSWIQEHLSELFQLLLIKTDHDQILHSIDSCKTKHFSSQLISRKQLVASLKNVSITQRKAGKELAIPLENISDYLKLPIFDCFFSNSYATLIFNVPLKRKNHEWSLYKIYHHKFAYRNQTCQLYPAQTSFLATSNTKSVLINSHMLHHCSVYEHKLCLLPDFSIDSSESVECAVGILKGRSTLELSKICAFQCTHNTEMSITQISGNKVVATNVNLLTVSCPTGVQVHRLEKTGALELTLGCKCNTTVDDFTLKPFFCTTSDTFDTELVYRTIPTLWSGLDFSFGQHEHVFLNLSNNTFDETWPHKIPVLNLTSLPNDLVPLRFSDSNINLLIIIWMSILTVNNLVTLAFVFWIVKQLIK